MVRRLEPAAHTTLWIAIFFGCSGGVRWFLGLYLYMADFERAFIHYRLCCQFHLQFSASAPLLGASLLLRPKPILSLRCAQDRELNVRLLPQCEEIFVALTVLRPVVCDRRGTRRT